MVEGGGWRVEKGRNDFLIISNQKIVMLGEPFFTDDDSSSDGDLALPDGSDALHEAVSQFNAEQVEIILDNYSLPTIFGVDVPNKEGKTPLYRACCCPTDKVEQGEVIVKLLLSRGANAVFTNYDNDTPLHRAAASHVRLLRPLVSRAGPWMVDIPNNNGNRPLHIAYQNGNEPCVKLLIHAGANENAVNYYGKKPCFYRRG